jgi:hypothetical protein
MFNAQCSALFPSIANVPAAVSPEVPVITAKVPSILAQVSPVQPPLALGVVMARLPAVLP